MERLLDVGSTPTISTILNLCKHQSKIDWCFFLFISCWLLDNTLRFLRLWTFLEISVWLSSVVLFSSSGFKIMLVLQNESKYSIFFCFLDYFTYYWNTLLKWGRIYQWSFLGLSFWGRCLIINAIFLMAWD